MGDPKIIIADDPLKKQELVSSWNKLAAALSCGIISFESAKEMFFDTGKAFKEATSLFGVPAKQVPDTSSKATPLE